MLHITINVCNLFVVEQRLGNGILSFRGHYAMGCHGYLARKYLGLVLDLVEQ